jgi:hypothetical protein
MVGGGGGGYKGDYKEGRESRPLLIPPLGLSRDGERGELE